MEEGLAMGWLPSEPSDAFWFAVAPVTAVPTAVYAAAAATTGDYPAGKPDWKANIRNTAIWGAIAAGVYGWNQYYYPGQYAFTTGAQAYKLVGHLAANPVTIGIGAATVAAIGYVATAEVHGGATGMLVGDMNVGMSTNLSHYSAGGSSSNIFPGMQFSDLYPWNW